jgi:hypothetical protein
MQREFLNPLSDHRKYLAKKICIESVMFWHDAKKLALISTQVEMSKMKTLVDWVLENSGDAARYHRRMTANPTLAKLGCLPRELTDISNHECPWYCHGLAFRMATYSDDKDYFFDRWETLLKLAQKAKGWDGEYARWSNSADHWAKKWDKFEQFIWMLQCYEYFSERGHKVSFPVSNGASPDLLVERQGLGKIYAECYFYSKWWMQKGYLWELLRKIDENLSIKHTHNVKIDPSKNPFLEGKQFVTAFGQLAEALTPVRLAELRVAAKEITPQTVCEFGDNKFLLDGEGYYGGSLNAQGDEAVSLPIYLNEIIMAKKDKNNLNGSRPNIVMANTIIEDFQLGFPKSQDLVPANLVLPVDIDEVRISICGFAGKLEACQQVLKIWRNGYAGCGF